MPIRLQELHPSLVHYPIALLPLAVGADLLARALKRPALARAAPSLWSLTTAFMAASAAAGLVAQRAVKADGPAHDLLATHRNLNIGLFAGTAVLTVLRHRGPPSAGGMAAGIAGVALMAYTAYLGGKMVYAHGVGVKAAGGLDEARAPALTAGHWRDAARIAGDNAAQALAHTAGEWREGRFAPAVAPDHPDQRGRPA